MLINSKSIYIVSYILISFRKLFHRIYQNCLIRKSVNISIVIVYNQWVYSWLTTPIATYFALLMPITDFAKQIIVDGFITQLRSIETKNCKHVHTHTSIYILYESKCIRSYGLAACKQTRERKQNACNIHWILVMAMQSNNYIISRWIGNRVYRKLPLTTLPRAKLGLIKFIICKSNLIIASFWGFK